VLRGQLGRGETLHAPHLLDVEVLHALRRAARGGTIDTRTAGRAIRRLRSLRLTKYPHGPLLRRVWQLREHLTAYDATYVALAERLGARLVTRDARLSRAPGIRVRVDVIQAPSG
jgi:predicted nucleic acid-binding protein